MPDSKRAHSDLKINVEGPVEELDAVQERPRDLSPSLSLSVENSKALSDAFGHLGNIADNANDLNRQINSYDAMVDYENRKEQMLYRQKQLEQLEEMKLSNQVYAKRKEMLTDVAKAREEAINSPDDVSVYDAMVGAMENYRDSFSDSFEGSKMWDKMFNQDLTHISLEGLSDEFTIEHSKMYYNMESIKNEAFQNVVKGTMDPDTGMAFLIQKTADVRGNVPNLEQIKKMGEHYQELVIAKALNFGKVSNGSNAIATANSIRSLITQYGKKTYGLLDTEGNPIMQNGEQASMELTLTSKTVEELLRLASSLESKASSTGTSGSANSVEEYMEAVGGEDLLKKGISKYLTSTNTQSAYADYQSAINSVMGQDGLTDKQKIAKCKGISDFYYRTVAPAVATAEAMKLTPKSRANHKLLQAKVAQIDKALNSGQNMTDFALEFDLDGGGTFYLKPPLETGEMSVSNTALAAKNVWTSIRNTINKTLQAETTSDFLYGTNDGFTTAVDTAEGSMSWADLVTLGPEGEVSINKNNKDYLTQNFRYMKQAFVDATGNSGHYSSIPSTTLTKFAAGYEVCPNPAAKAAYARVVANSLMDAGYSDFLVTPNFLKGANAAEKAAFAALQREFYLSRPELADIRKRISKSAEYGSGTYTTEAAKVYLDEKNLSGSELITEITNIITDNNVPPEYQESLRATLTDIAVSYAQLTTDPTEKVDKGTILSAMKSVADKNFISLNSPFVKKTVFVGNPALLQGGSINDAEKNAQYLGKLSTIIGNDLTRSLKNAGAVKSEAQLDLRFDSTTGNIQVKVDGRTIGINNKKSGSFSTSIGIPYNFEKIRPEGVSEGQWIRTMSDYISISSTLSFAADSMKQGTVANHLFDPINNTKVNRDILQTDSFRMLSIMQQENFMEDFSEAMQAGDMLAVQPAPAYLKEVFKRTLIATTDEQKQYSNYSDYDGTYKDIPDITNKMLDFAYSRSRAFDKVDTVVNKPLSYEMRGFNYMGVLTAAKQNGFVITRDYDPLNVPGVKGSSHNRGMALDFGVYANNMEDHTTGLTKIKSLENFTGMLNNNPSYSGKVKYILTSRPELLENKPEYKEYAKFRAMKGATGEPLFRDAREIDKKLLKRNNHSNHFHVEFKEQVVRSDRKEFVGAYRTLAKDMVDTAPFSKNAISSADALGLLYAVGENYNKTTKSGGYGMANLTDKEYEALGLKGSCKNDPILQARAAANRFQHYANVLGSKDLAVYALLGAKFYSSSDKRDMSISEIMASGKMAGVHDQRYTLSWAKKNGKIDLEEQDRLTKGFARYKNALTNKAYNIK